MTEKTENTLQSTTGYNEQTTTTTEMPVPGNDQITDIVDEYGYKQVPTEDSIPTPPNNQKEESETEETKTSKETKSEDDTEVEKKATGYSNEPEKPKKEETKSEDEKSETEVDIEKLKTDITETVKNLPEGYDQEKVVKFAMENGFSNDQVKAYVELQNTSNADAIEAHENSVAKQKSDWYNELKDDTTFGGENFDLSIKRSEKVLEEFFPNLKKVLTDKGGMVPPYIMKDFLNLHKVLNPTAPLVNGEPITPVTEDDGNFLDNMYK